MSLRDFTRSNGKPISSLLRTFGGKFYLARRLHALTPDHDTFIDLFGGAGNMTIQRLSPNGIINDLNPLRAAVFDALSDKDKSEYLQRELEKLDYTETTFLRHRNLLDANLVRDLDAVVSYVVVSRMSRDGLEKDFSYSTRLRQGTPGDENAWNNAVASIPLLHERFRFVRTYNLDAVGLLLSLISAGAYRTGFLYLDPPYHHDTRVSGTEYGAFEMNEQAHNKLLDALCLWPGKAMISGYDCSLYAERLSAWNKYSFDMPNHSGQSKKKQRRTEQVWTNYRRF